MSPSCCLAAAQKQGIDSCKHIHKKYFHSYIYDKSGLQIYTHMAAVQCTCQHLPQGQTTCSTDIDGHSITGYKKRTLDNWLRHIHTLTGCEPV